MRGKDHLFHLIHSLSKSEKRYFTLDARKSGKTNSRYLELFQLINKQKTFDDTPLKKKFKTRLGEDVVPSISDIIKQPEFEGREITKTEFEQLWIAHAKSDS